MSKTTTSRAAIVCAILAALLAGADAPPDLHQIATILLALAVALAVGEDADS